MVKRDRLKDGNIRRLYNKRRYKEMKSGLEEMGIREGEIAVDYILNRVMRHVIISPMVVIESRGSESLLGHENERHYWSVYFEGEEGRKRREGYQEDRDDEKGKERWHTIDTMELE
jgi:hypothetical protein